jgi:hypothetical protein
MVYFATNINDPSMENKRLKLPIGIQTFEKLRERNCVYVDKTKYLVDLIDNIDICFLARPRRFGKSLTVSTFDALFSGKKELFKGLYAEEFLNRPDFEPSPVIRLDMSSVATDCGIDALKNSIKQLIKELANKLKVELPEDLHEGDMLRKLIINAASQYNRKAVILLDEYDKPYTDFVNDPDMAEKIRDVLRNLYVQIKSNDEYIRFTFITGISKFARFGVFSTLNTPLDISLMPKYAEICGYTEAEIIQYFPDYLDETAADMNITTEWLIERMREYYNGFSFDDEAQARLYNPYSTLSFFEEKKWYNYWIDSGRSKVIADYMKNRYLTVEQFRSFPISRNFAKTPGDMDSAPPEGFLYQCGYLTLRPGTSDDLSLDYPNTEVLNSMSAFVAQNLLQYKGEGYTYCRRDLLEGLMTMDDEKVITVFNRLLAGIPYDDYVGVARQSVSLNGIPVQEWLYRTSILSFLRGCGVMVFPEIHSNLGRSDLVVAHRGVIWVIEIKVAYTGDDPAKKAEEAFRQIEEKNYAKAYSHTVCIGLAIDDTARQITNWKTEKS